MCIKCSCTPFGYTFEFCNSKNGSGKSNFRIEYNYTVCNNKHSPFAPPTLIKYI